MTCIVETCKTKKELRDRLERRESVCIIDPSMFNPRTFYTDEMSVGQKETVTNHPKRSWFATIERTNKGFRVT